MGPSRWSLSSKYPTYPSHASVYTFYCPLIMVRARTGDEVTFTFRSSTAPRALSFSLKRVGSPFLLIIAGAFIRSKLVTKRLKTLHRPRKDRILVTVVCYASHTTALHYFLVTSSFPGLITCPR